jgi:hypothetical protein
VKSTFAISGTNLIIQQWITARSQAVRSNKFNGKDKGNTSGVANHYRFDELNLPVMKRTKKVKG